MEFGLLTKALTTDLTPVSKASTSTSNHFFVCFDEPEYLSIYAEVKASFYFFRGFSVPEFH